MGSNGPPLATFQQQSNVYTVASNGTHDYLSVFQLEGFSVVGQAVLLADPGDVQDLVVY